jgi:shikimate dehydrogenase
MGNDHLAIDLIYNPTETLFLKNAKTQGASIMNGESMLKTQAMKSWALWNP